MDRRNLFWDREVVITITDSEGFGPASIEAKVSFAANASTEFFFVWLMMSIVGIPLAYAWRALSIRGCRAFVCKVFERSEKLFSHSSFGQIPIARAVAGPYR